MRKDKRSYLARATTAGPGIKETNIYAFNKMLLKRIHTLNRGSVWSCCNLSFELNFRLFLSYQFKCQPISQVSVNADLRY